MLKKLKKMTSFAKLILTIVRANPNRLLRSAARHPLHQIAASDIADVYVSVDCRGHIKVNFIFDEKSKAINDIANDTHIVRYSGMSISDAISYTYISCVFIYITDSADRFKRSGDVMADYVCFMAKEFLGVDATSLEEVKLNLVLMGMMSDDLFEASATA